jgi:hypothetical protein
MTDNPRLAELLHEYLLVLTAQLNRPKDDPRHADPDDIPAIAGEIAVIMLAVFLGQHAPQETHHAEMRRWLSTFCTRLPQRMAYSAAIKTTIDSITQPDGHPDQTPPSEETHKG